MYTPAHFAEPDLAACQALIRANSFGILISAGPDGIVATHLPFLIEPARGPLGTLVAHMARANPQWQKLPEAGELLVVFPGIHAYISPAWYQSRLAVPTWNYEAVHAYGTARLIEPPDDVKAMLHRLVAENEAAAGSGWSMDRLPADFVDKQVKGIIGFEIALTRLEGKRKLSQNRPAQDAEGAIAGLLGTGDPANMAVAEAMRRVLATRG